jgi:hypothetical protein
MANTRSEPRPGATASPKDDPVQGGITCKQPTTVAASVSASCSGSLENLETNQAALPETMPLEHYIRKALPWPIRRKLPKSLFRPTPSMSAPTLRRGITNRILVYRGCFNPPHIGHRLLLSNAFFCSQFPDMIAAVVDFASGIASEKLHAEAKLHLSREERIRLWQDDRLDPWAYFTPSKSAMKMVWYAQRLAQEDGFQIEFVRLLGAEYLANGRSRGSNSCIFGSLDGRIWPGFDPVGGPSAGIQGPGAWSKCSSPGEILLERVKKKELSAEMVLSLLFEEVHWGPNSRGETTCSTRPMFTSSTLYGNLPRPGRAKTLSAQMQRSKSCIDGVRSVSLVS